MLVSSENMSGFTLSCPCWTYILWHVVGLQAYDIIGLCWTILGLIILRYTFSVDYLELFPFNSHALRCSTQANLEMHSLMSISSIHQVDPTCLWSSV